MTKQVKSRAVRDSVVVGTPAAIVGGYLGAVAAAKLGLPVEVTGAALSLLASWTSSVIAHVTAKAEAKK